MMNFSFDFKEKVVLVTGAAGGIGSQVARSFADSGAKVLATDLNPVIKELAANYGGLGIEADLSLPGEARRVVTACIKQWEPPEILINIAAFGRLVPITELSPEEWQKNLDVNLTSVYQCTTEVLPHMIEHGKGSIISFSSVVAEEGGKYQAHYAAAKAGIESFSRSLAREVSPLGIRVNVIAPGMLDAPLIDSPEMKKKLASRYPVLRPGRPEEFIGPVLFLASDAASYITGHTLDVNGGRTMS
jgi:NAD(P)-dependent dehydrogenase (short-subunit alcohol dehydrogenase family)